MKITWSLGLLVVLLLACQITAALVPPNIIRKCVDSTKIPAVDLALFYGTDYRMVSTPIKCYITCIFDSTGFVTNGKISNDILFMAKNAEETEKFKGLIEVCSNLNVEGECEPTFEAFKCWMQQGKF